MLYATSLIAKSSQAISNIKTTNQKVLQAQYDISSGTSLTVASDDPVAAGQALRLHETKSRLDTYIANIDTASSYQGATDSALQDVVDLLREASQIAVSGSSSATMDDDARSALAEEVSALSTRLRSVANSEVAGRYLFGGTATDSAPFVETASGTVYRGTTASQEIPVSSTLNAQLTLPGNSIFCTPVNTFTVLDDLETALRSGDTAAIESSVTAIGEVSSNAYRALAKVGAATDSLESVRGILDDIRISIQTDLSTTADTDMAEASVRLSSANVAYEAALEMATRIAKPTILDFL